MTTIPPEATQPRQPVKPCLLTPPRDDRRKQHDDLYRVTRFELADVPDRTHGAELHFPTRVKAHVDRVGQPNRTPTLYVQSREVRSNAVLLSLAFDDFARKAKVVQASQQHGAMRVEQSTTLGVSALPRPGPLDEW